MLRKLTFDVNEIRFVQLAVERLLEVAYGDTPQEQYARNLGKSVLEKIDAVKSPLKKSY